MRGSMIAVAGIGLAGFGAAVWWAAGADDQDAPPEVHAIVAPPRAAPDAAVSHDTAPPPDASDIDGPPLGDGAGPTVGLGHYGPIGHGRRDRTAAIPAIEFGTPMVRGDLDAGVIRHDIERKGATLLSCYQEALVSNPTLTGTLDVYMFIAPDGDVAIARGEGLDDVVACVHDVLRTISFPKPKDGGGVEVTVSFTFLGGG